MYGARTVSFKRMLGGTTSRRGMPPRAHGVEAWLLSYARELDVPVVGFRYGGHVTGHNDNPAVGTRTFRIDPIRTAARLLHLAVRVAPAPITDTCKALVKVSDDAGA
jgi:hypothetical protein